MSKKWEAVQRRSRAFFAFDQIKPAKMNLSLFGRLAELAGLEVLGELIQNLGLVAEHHMQVLAD